MADTNTYKGHTYTNGNVPSAVLKKLDGKHGTRENTDAYLRSDAADSFNQVRAEIGKKFGYDFTVRGWNRDYAQQVQMLLDRSSTTHNYGRGRRWYNGKWHYLRGAAVATPGYSNHGWGTTIDINDFGVENQFNHPNYKKFSSTLKKHGWNNDEGRRIGEPWHWTYVPANDKYRNKTPQHKDTTKSKDWFDMATQKDLETALLNVLKSTEGRKLLTQAVWQTDGVVKAPADAETPTNKYWTPEGLLKATRSNAIAARKAAEKG